MGRGGGSECKAHHIFFPRFYGNLATAKVVDCLHCSSPISAKNLSAQQLTNKDEPIMIKKKIIINKKNLISIKFKHTFT